MQRGSADARAGIAHIPNIPISSVESGVPEMGMVGIMAMLIRMNPHARNDPAPGFYKNQKRVCSANPRAHEQASPISPTSPFPQSSPAFQKWDSGDNGDARSL